MSWPKRILIALAILLSVAGALLSVQLLSQHFLGRSAIPILSAACGADGSSCDKVLASRWSVFPPKPKVVAASPGSGAQQKGAKGAEERAGIPVSLFGLLYFAFLTAWFVGVGCPNLLGRQWQLVPITAVVFGNACSIFFIYIMASVVKAWCPYCLATHAINFLLLVIVLVTCPRRSRAAIISKPRTSPSVARPQPAVAHPSTRLAFVTIALGVSLWLLGALVAVALAAAGQTRVLARTVKDLTDCPDALLAIYSKQERRDLHIRPDDPARGGPGDALATLVVFSGIVCPRCMEFDALVTGEIEPLFNGRLRVICKHFPWSSECNRAAGSARIVHACDAAYAVEAARLQGGDKLFWRMVDEIRAHQDDLASLNYAASAARLGIDADRLMADMRGPAVRGRIAEDIALGSSLGVKTTPVVYLNGRLVPAVARDNLGFWQLVASRLAGSGADSAPAISTLPAAGAAAGEVISPAHNPLRR